MKNYEPGTIVPVGTKILRNHPTNQCDMNWSICTVTDSTIYYVTIEWEWDFKIENFAPYKEVVEDIQSYDSLPTYITLKFIPWVSHGSIIVNLVQKWRGIKVIQDDSNFSESLSVDQEDYIRWLLKEHPEDFKKIN